MPAPAGRSTCRSGPDRAGTDRDHHGRRGRREDQAAGDRPDPGDSRYDRGVGRRDPRRSCRIRHRAAVQARAGSGRPVRRVHADQVPPRAGRCDRVPPSGLQRPGLRLTRVRAVRQLPADGDVRAAARPTSQRSRSRRSPSASPSTTRTANRSTRSNPRPTSRARRRRSRSPTAPSRRSSPLRART